MFKQSQAENDEADEDGRGCDVSSTTSVFVKFTTSTFLYFLSLLKLNQFSLTYFKI